MGTVARMALAVCLSLPGCARSTSASSPPDAQGVDPPPSARAGAATEAIEASTPPACDPLCQWRNDDASHDPDNERALALAPGLISRRGSAPYDRIHAAFGVRARGVAACAHRVPDAPPYLRVRVDIDPQGRATWVGTDYRVSLPDAARSCVESSLQSRPFPLATPDGLTVTYRFAFAAQGE